MGFDYGWSCPNIDRSIKDLKDDFENYMGDIIEELCPLMTTERKHQLANDYAISLYDICEYRMEEVRETNSDMRKEADRQINILEREYDEMKGERDELEDKNHELSKEVESLQDELNNIEL